MKAPRHRLTIEELDAAAQGYLFGDPIGQIAAQHTPPISRTTLWGRLGILRLETGESTTIRACQRWVAETRYASHRARMYGLPRPNC